MADPFTWSEVSELILTSEELHLRQRLEAAIRRRGWSANRLAEEAQRMGLDSLSQSVISRLLTAERIPKRLTVHQLIGLSKLLGVPFGELLLPASAAQDAEAWRGLGELGDVVHQQRQLQKRREVLTKQLRAAVERSPELGERISESRYERVRRFQADRDASDADDRLRAEQLGTDLPGEPSWPAMPSTVEAHDIALGNEEESDNGK